MANIKSAKKRIRVIDKKTARNRRVRNHLKAILKAYDAAIEAGDKDAAKDALLKATSSIDKAQKKGVYHKNYASRKISRLNLAVNKMA